MNIAIDARHAIAAAAASGAAMLREAAARLGAWLGPRLRGLDRARVEHLLAAGDARLRGVLSSGSVRLRGLAATLLAAASEKIRSRRWREAARDILASSGREISSTLGRFAAYCAVLGVACWGVWILLAGVPVAAPEDHAAASDWTEVERPAPAFAVDMADFVKAEPRYRIHRHRVDGSRRDRLAWDDGSQTLAIELLRPGAETEARAAPAATRSGLLRGTDPAGATMDSAFGPVTLVRSALRGRDGRACLGFFGEFDEPPLVMSGLACGRDGEDAARTMLACGLDRMRLVSAGGDARLAGLFARAALRRSQCGPGRLPRAAGPRPAVWLDGGMPALRR